MAIMTTSTETIIKDEDGNILYQAKQIPIARIYINLMKVIL